MLTDTDKHLDTQTVTVENNTTLAARVVLKVFLGDKTKMMCK